MDAGTVSKFRGATIEYKRVEDVQDSDEIACWLSDDTAYVTVTGKSERVRDLSRYGIPPVTVTTFVVSGAPWWVDDTFTSAEQGETLPIRRS